LFDFVVDEEYLSCMVVGNSSEYEIEIRPWGSKLSLECSCPVETNCKHCLALALLLAWEAQKRGYVLPPEILRDYHEAFARLNSANEEIPEVEILLGQRQSSDKNLSERWWDDLLVNSPWKEQETVYRTIIKDRLKGISFW